jgi:hypothetical protein
VFFLLLCLHSAALLGSEASVDLPFIDSSSAGPSLADPSPPIWPIRVAAGYNFGTFIGVRESYTEIELFAMQDPFAPSWEPFLDMRVSRFDKGKWVGNLGGGIRARNGSQVWGLNLFYDYQRVTIVGRHPGDIHRVGLGLEFFEGPWDFRVNSYLPIDDLVHGHRHTYNFIGGFQASCRLQDYAFKGIDCEVGRPLCSRWGFALYGAMGPYFYHSRKGTSLLGLQGRIEFSWNKYLTAEVRTSYDHKYKSTIQGQISLNFPLTKFSDLCCQDWCDGEIFARPVRRNNVMFVTHCCDWEWNWGANGALIVQIIE